MKLLIISSALCVVCAVFVPILRRTSPEYSAVLVLAASAVILIAAFASNRIFTSLLDVCNELCGENGETVSVMLKCTGIGVITAYITQLCRENTLLSLANSVELAGTLCAVGIAMPLIVTVLRLVGELI